MTTTMTELKLYATAVLEHNPDISSKPAKKPSDLIVPVFHAMTDLYDCDDKDLALEVAKVIFYEY